MIGGTPRLLRIELRRSLGLFCFPLLAAAAWLLVRSTLPTEVQIWPVTSRATLYAATLLGPLTGGLSAYAAGRNRRAGLDDMLATTPKPVISRELATWAGTALWGLMACVVVAGFYVYLALRGATWGGPSPAPLLLGLLALAAYSALGYAAGRHVPSRFTAPLVAVLLFVPQALLSTLGYSLELFVPLTDSGIETDVFRRQGGAWGWRAIWFVALVGLALSAAALKGKRSRAAWGAFAACGVAAVVTAGVLASTDAWSTLRGKPVPYEPVCEEGGITVCVHPAYRSMLPEAAAAINAVARPVAGFPAVPTRAEQHGEPVALPTAPDRNLLFALDVEKHEWVGYGPLTSEVARAITNAGGAAKNQPWAESPDEPSIGSGQAGHSCQASSTEAQKAVAHWLLQQSGIRHIDPMWSDGCARAEKAFKRFAGLNPGERREWLTENFADLRAGELTLKELP